MASVYLQDAWLGKDPLDVPLWVQIVSYCTSRQRPDLDNLLAAPLDALQKNGVIKNDRLVCSVDGSRRLIDNGNPRVELRLRPYTGD